MTPVTLTFDPWFSDYQTLPSFYHSTPSCQSSYKSINNFLSYRGNRLEIVIFNGFLTPVTFTCDLQRRPIFLTIELSFHFIIVHHPAKGHQNRSITFFALLRQELKNCHFFNVYLTPVTLTFDQIFWLSNLAFLFSLHTILPKLIKIGQ